MKGERKETVAYDKTKKTLKGFIFKNTFGVRVVSCNGGRLTSLETRRSDAQSIVLKVQNGEKF